MKDTSGFTHWVIVILIAIMSVGLVGVTWYYEGNKEKIRSQDQEYFSKRDIAIEKYLLSQKDFVWETEIESSKTCVFENLESKNELFPLSLWISCNEYKNEEGEIKHLSGVSLPILLNYPNELSYFEESKFSHKMPRNGSLFETDIREMFSKEAQKKISNH